MEQCQTMWAGQSDSVEADLWVCLGFEIQISFSAWFCSPVDATMFVWINTCLSALINKHEICWTRNYFSILLFAYVGCDLHCFMCYPTLTVPLFVEHKRRKRSDAVTSACCLQWRSSIKTTCFILCRSSKTSQTHFEVSRDAMLAAELESSEVELPCFFLHIPQIL